MEWQRRIKGGRKEGPEESQKERQSGRKRGARAVAKGDSEGLQCGLALCSLLLGLSMMTPPTTIMDQKWKMWKFTVWGTKNFAFFRALSPPGRMRSPGRPQTQPWGLRHRHELTLRYFISIYANKHESHIFMEKSTLLPPPTSEVHHHTVQQLSRKTNKWTWKPQPRQTKPHTWQPPISQIQFQNSKYRHTMSPCMTLIPYNSSGDILTQTTARNYL